MKPKVLSQVATIFTVLLFLTGLCFASLSRTTFFVCEQNCTDKDCKPLEEYVEFPVPNNSIFRFCGGNHTLTRPWNVSGVRDITLQHDAEGETETIYCKTNGSAGILFSNVSGLKLRGIGVYNCGTDAGNYETHTINAALVFLGGEDLLLQSVIAYRSPVAGMSIINVAGQVFIEGSLFANASISRENRRYLTGNFIGYNRFLRRKITMEIKDTRFENNRYIGNEACDINDLTLSAGLSIILQHGDVMVSFSNVSLSGNGGCAGGNLAILLFNFYKLVNNTSIVVGNGSIIERGKSNVGGGVFVRLVNSDDNSSSFVHATNEGYERPFLHIQDSTFRNNAAYYVGGAIYLKHMEAYHFSTPGIIKIDNCTFVGNELLNGTASGGWALHFTTFIVREYEFHERPQMKVIVSQCTFTKHAVNSSKLGNAVIFVKTNPYFGISNTNITDNKCTGILAISSNIVVSGKVNISRNVAFSGGGMLLCAGTILYLRRETHLVIVENKALHTGGGIHVESECIINRPRCFFQFDSDAVNIQSKDTPRITVKDNRADYAGCNLYGGSVDNCYMINLKTSSLPIFRKIFEVSKNNFSKGLYSMVTSPPRRVCLVEGSKCSDEKELHIYPGQSITLKVVIVGQLNGSVPGTVYMNVDPELEDIVHIPKKDKVQAILTKVPQNLSYRIYSTKEGITAKLSLGAMQLGSSSNSLLVLSIKIKSCPLGYTLIQKSSQSRCSCSEVRKYINNIRCSIVRKVGIEYHPPAWIGMVQTGSTGVIAVSKSCPQDYCSITSKLFLDLKRLKLDSTIQCSFHRVGVLCGGCIDGYSLLLGSSKCSQGCSNYCLLLLPVFALAGIALVFLITFLSLTVTEATLNGLIFYANMIQIYAFFMFESNNTFLAPFLKVFIAWINLDFGIESCFFVGMDGFSKTLLQFAFPVYIWMIAVTIILLSRKYDTIAKICGRDSVKVLATLILLSYSKILRAVTDALHFTRVHYIFKDTSSQSSMHWTSDGHLRYLEGKHIVIFLIGAAFAAGGLPFMFTLLCIQKIGLVSNWPCFCWVHRLKPFFDSVTGPFTDRGRFWVGFLLFIRILVMGVYSFRLSSSNGAVMVMTVLICLILLCIGAMLPRGIYKRPILNTLESFFIANLGFLYLGLFCSMHYDNVIIKICAVHISIGGSFIVFVLIITRHILMKIKCSRILYRFKQRENQEWHDESNADLKGNFHTSFRQTLLHFGSSEEREPLLSTID